MVRSKERLERKIMNERKNEKGRSTLIKTEQVLAGEEN